MFKTKIDLIGKRFGNWIVISDNGKRNSKGMILWYCKCDCGNYSYVRSDKLRKGRSESCGCMKNESIRESLIKHGHNKKNNESSTHVTWRSMIQRVTNPNNCSYKYYEDIKICGRWMKFENFLDDMGERPEGMTLDRINSYGNYELENCKWSTPKEQSNNKRVKL